MNFSPDQVDERPEHNKQDFNQQSVHFITPNYQHAEFIVDFQLIERPTDLSLIYTTHLNNIYFKNLTQNTEETLYQNSVTKGLIQDHFISQLYYFRDCDKIFAVS